LSARAIINRGCIKSITDVNEAKLNTTELRQQPFCRAGLRPMILVSNCDQIATAEAVHAGTWIKATVSDRCEAAET
jgi:hypothetical protein